MRFYSSFLIRCWLTRDASQGERPVLQVEHIQTGTSTRAASLAEAETWIFEACRAVRQPGPETTQDAESAVKGDREPYAQASDNFSLRGAGHD